jgi:hypothetical protein
MKNDGKSEARDLELRYKATLLTDKDTLRFDDKNLESTESRYFQAGGEVPTKPENPRFQIMTTSVKVRDKSEQIVLASSEEGRSFLAGGSPESVAVYGHMTYSDFSGSHKAKFCDFVYLMKFGTHHTVSKNERTCFHYNQQEDQLTSMPKISQDSQTNQIQISPVLCEKPKE